MLDCNLDWIKKMCISWTKLLGGLEFKYLTLCATQHNLHFLFLFAEQASFHFLSLEDEGIFITSASTATTPESTDKDMQEVNILPNEASSEDHGTSNTTDA